jgi:phage gpG-like protein
VSSGPIIEQHGAGKAALDLEQLGRRAHTATRDTSSTVGGIFRQSEQRRFDAGGPGWPPLADSTREKKERLGQDPRVLRATEVLYRSLTEPQAAMQIDEHSPDEIRFGTTVPYARFHDTGHGVPQRTLIELRPGERRQITEALETYIARGET